MKKGSFDLKGKAIDCRQLPAMGEAGEEIFRALKVACSEGEYAYGFLEVRTHPFMRYAHNLKQRKVSGFTSRGLDQLILPVDVLGQARIDAAKEGATILFEGESAPPMEKSKIYWDDCSYSYEELPSGIVSSKYVIAYKLIEEKEKEKQPSIESRILAEKVGAKHDAGKPLYNLIPVHAEAELVDVLTFGATKYAPNQWRNVENATERYTAAAMRHLAAYRMGETHDTESGKHHLAHAMCCLAFIIEMDLEQNK